MARQPVHVKITRWLRSEATRRGPGQLMPTIAEVCAKFDVGGVQTVRNAYAPLMDEGLVVRVRSPRRWAVADHAPKPSDKPDAGPVLEEIEQCLSRAQALFEELRLMC